MDIAIPEELRTLRDTVRRFVETEVLPLESEYSEELPPEVKQPLQGKLKDLGLWALSVPEKYGGAGLGSLAVVLVTEELYKSMLSRTLIGGDVMAQLYDASDYLKESYLYPTVRGERRGSGAFSEPNAAGDLGGIQTSAVRNGDTYVINGTKTWIGKGHEADHIFVLARMKGTERREGMTWFVVDKGTPGFEVGRVIPMMGYTTTAELRFVDCVIPASHRVTPEGRAWDVAQETLNHGRLNIGAEVLGMAQRCQDMAVEHSKHRVTFGQPLADRQGIQLMIADSEIEMYAIRSMLYGAAMRADMGDDIERDASIIKVFSTEMAGKVVDRALQIHGASGYSKDLVIEQFYRAVRAFRIFEGPNEVLRWRLGRNMLRY